MKKIVLALLFFSSSLAAEPKSVGDASQNAANTASNWRNWAFAGGASVLAGVGVYVLSLDQGKAPSSSAHQ